MSPIQLQRRAPGCVMRQRSVELQARAGCWLVQRHPDSNADPDFHSDCKPSVPRSRHEPERPHSQVTRQSCRYAELLELAKARHVIVPPAYRIDGDEALARTVAAGAFITEEESVPYSCDRRSGQVVARKVSTVPEKARGRALHRRRNLVSKRGLSVWLSAVLASMTDAISAWSSGN